jgi:hypothetical protein
MVAAQIGGEEGFSAKGGPKFVMNPGAIGRQRSLFWDFHSGCMNPCNDERRFALIDGNPSQAPWSWTNDRKRAAADFY